MRRKIQYGDVFFTTSSETPEEVGIRFCNDLSKFLALMIGKDKQVHNPDLFNIQSKILIVIQKPRFFKPMYLGILLKSKIRHESQ